MRQLIVPKLVISTWMMNKWTIAMNLTALKLTRTDTTITMTIVMTIEIKVTIRMTILMSEREEKANRIR